MTTKAKAHDISIRLAKRHLYSSQAPGSRQHNRPSCYGSPHLYYYLPYPMTPHPTANMPTSLVLMPQVYESFQPQFPTDLQHHLKHCHVAKYESRACHLSDVSSSVTNTFAKTVSFSHPIPMMQTLNPSHMSHTTSTTIYFYKSPKHNSNVRLDPENSLQQDIRTEFQKFPDTFVELFSPQIIRYKGAAGSFEAKINMGPVESPQHK